MDTQSKKLEGSNELENRATWEEEYNWNKKLEGINRGLDDTEVWASKVDDGTLEITAT